MKFIDGTNKLSIEFEEHDTDDQKRIAYNLFFFLCNLIGEFQKK